jgi:voltage-gated potassium channel
VVVLVLIGVGTLGFYQIAGDNGNWSDALYMTLISISTVGYGEIVPLHSIRIACLPDSLRLPAWAR